MSTTSRQDDHSTGLSASTTGQHGIAPQRLLTGRVVLLATDGSADAVAAARVAQALERIYRAEVQVVHVVDTRGAPIPPPLDVAMGLADALAGEAVHGEQESIVRQDLSTALDCRITWPVRITRGSPAPAIAREAARTDAVLIVAGLHRHGTLDRALGEETTFHLMQQASCPVVAIVHGTTGLPERVLAAVDFSPASIHAARAAAAIAAHGARFTLAYVPAFAHAEPSDGEALIHKLGVTAAFAMVEKELNRDDLRLDHVVLHHTQPSAPSAILLDYAESMDCDLIAAGSARHSRLDKWILGSVSTELVRDGRRSVLIIPRTTKPSR